ncbi:MAG: zinc-dependent metalloprotease [Actinomycetota bacterium]
MSTPFGFGMDPESLRDAPLFRELQRVMASGGGDPVNWELARQVGVASAAEAGADPEPTDADRAALQDAVRVAELHVARTTGMDPPAAVARVTPLRRAEWVADAASGLRGLIEPAAVRMTEALGGAFAEQLPPEAAPMASMLSQLGPLVHGSQVGQVLGAQAGSALGGYEVALPRVDPAVLAFVPANLASLQKDWSLDAAELRTWVAVHEVSHRLSLSGAWARGSVSGLVDDFLATITIDVAAITERLAALQPGDAEGLEQALGGEGDGLFGTVLDDEQRIKLARIQAFVGAAEGWADHVTEVVGRTLLGSHERIEEAMRRRGEAQDAEPIFTRLLGIPLDRATFATGRRFCDAVAERTDEATLAQMWASAEAMPSFPELEEPTLWLSRTV